VRESKLWIVGRKIPQRIVDFARQRDDIEITDSIEDAREAYKGASVMITPIKGSGGTRLKVLEAMAAGLPVVSTSIGVAGLGIMDNKEALIKDSMDGLAEDTVKLLRNGKLARKIGLSGQRFVEKNFDWDVIVKLHDKIYKEVLIK
jgi:glycosyltransferase involved in cell wall biosynthesis